MAELLTVKEFAAIQRRSVQSVYNQMKRKSNAELLKGHIYEQKVGNHTVKMLDEEAVRILSEGSKQSPQVVIADGLKEKVEALEAENKMLLLKVAELQDKVISRDEQLLEVKDQIADLKEQLLALTTTKDPVPEPEPIDPDPDGSAKTEPLTPDMRPEQPDPEPQQPKKWWQRLFKR